MLADLSFLDLPHRLAKQLLRLHREASPKDGGRIRITQAELASLLASMWVSVDVRVPYSAGELLARIRERGTVELEYGPTDVRVHGHVAPGLAGELRNAATATVGSDEAGDAAGA